MSKITNSITELTKELSKCNARLIAVSKYYSVEKIDEAYQVGQRIFGESRLQELTTKQNALPKDIEWHFIGHLQTNKVRQILPLVHLIHSVDSIKLLQEIDKEASKQQLEPKVLLQIFIAREETKYGFEISELYELFKERYFDTFQHIRIVGLMAMASNTNNEQVIEQEFSSVKSLFDRLKAENLVGSRFNELSMGMSSDYPIALMQGSTLVRIGSKIFED